MDKILLNEFLGQGSGHGNEMEITIHNLKALLKHIEEVATIPTTPETLFNLRRALVSLETLSNTMSGFVV